MKVLATNHTSFTVRDLKATVDFFTDVFGFTARYVGKPSEAFMAEVTGLDGVDVQVAIVQCPGHEIELFQYESPTPEEFRMRSCDVGFSHLAFTVDDLEEAVARAAPHGYKPSRGLGRYEVGRFNLTATYLRGPDGLAIELVQNHAPRPQ